MTASKSGFEGAGGRRLQDFLGPVLTWVEGFRAVGFDALQSSVHLQIGEQHLFGLTRPSLTEP